MESLIKFCIYSTEEDFFKYLMLIVAFDKQEQEIQNLLHKYSDELQGNN